MRGEEGGGVTGSDLKRCLLHQSDGRTVGVRRRHGAHTAFVIGCVISLSACVNIARRSFLESRTVAVAAVVVKVDVHALGAKNPSDATTTTYSDLGYEFALIFNSLGRL